MLYEISQIKRYLAKVHGLTYEGSDLDGRVVGGIVPDGEYMIPLGVSETPTLVAVKDDFISIDPVMPPIPGPAPTTATG